MTHPTILVTGATGKTGSAVVAQPREKGVPGRQPEDFETIARRYATRPEVQRTLGNQLKACLAFMSVPMRPGYSPDRFATEQTFPMPAKPLLDLANPRWKLEHSVQSSTAAKVRPLRAGVGA